MKLEIEAPLTVIVAKDESKRSARPLWVKVDWNRMAREEIAWAHGDRGMPAAIAATTVDASRPSDSDWGEQDDLNNIPKATQPSWIRALNLDEPEGDR